MSDGARKPREFAAESVGGPADAAARSPARSAPGFARRIIDWQRRHGRHDLPWQQTRDPYRIWLAEIMLQQTQVTTVVPYYLRFLGRFPDVVALAGATLDEVLALWAGLGYYSRARNLHRAAVIVAGRDRGHFPTEPAQLVELPGIGRSTAAAIAAFAADRRAAILDGNVKRVLCRAFAIEGFPGTGPVERELWALAEALLPGAAGKLRHAGMPAYTQGLMDLGATLCRPRQPGCPACPLAELCRARQAGRQAELPWAKRRPVLPERDGFFLVIDDGQAFWLEVRPAPGIWGGLLAPPEFAGGDPLAAAAALGFHPRDSRTLPEIGHTFTHFRLRLRPTRVRVAPAQRAAATGPRPVPYAAVASAALPTPVRRLLASLLEPDEAD